MAEPSSADQRKREQRASTAMGLWGLVVLFAGVPALISVTTTEASFASTPRVVTFVYTAWSVTVLAAIASVGSYFGIKLAKPRLAWLTALPAIAAIAAAACTLSRWWP